MIKLEKEIKEISSDVDSLIIKKLEEGHRDDFKDFITYQIKTGGKRLRPFLLVKFYQTLGGKDYQKAIHLASAIEIFHNYSLLIDDIIDKADFRRNKETSSKKYGSSLTLCLSSFYFSTIVNLLKGFDKEIFEIFSFETKRVMEGEIIDILQERSNRDEPFFLKNKYSRIAFSEYLEMIEKKTAALFRASVKMGAFAATGNKDIDLADKFGFNFGIGFQIKDDILDIFGNEKTFGKEIGKDIKEKKGGNIVILYGTEESKNIEKILKKDLLLEEDIINVVEEIKKTDAKKKAEKMYNEYMKTATECLQLLPKNDNTNSLLKVVEYIKNREK